MKNNSKMAEVYLRHIEIFVQSEDPDRKMLREFIDGWFQYDKGGPFILTKSDRPIKFNNPDPMKEVFRKPLLAMHFVSKDARAVLNGKCKGRVVKDHAVPINVIWDILSKRPKASKNEIKANLHSIYRLGVLTKYEHDCLSNIKLGAGLDKLDRVQMLAQRRRVFKRFAVGR